MTEGHFTLYAIDTHAVNATPKEPSRAARGGGAGTRRPRGSYPGMQPKKPVSEPFFSACFVLHPMATDTDTSHGFGASVRLASVAFGAEVPSSSKEARYAAADAGLEVRVRKQATGRPSGLLRACE